MTYLQRNVKVTDEEKAVKQWRRFSHSDEWAFTRAPLVWTGNPCHMRFIQVPIVAQGDPGTRRLTALRLAGSNKVVIEETTNK